LSLAKDRRNCYGEDRQGVARQDGWEPFLLQSFLSRDGVMRCLGGDLAGHADGFGHRRLGMSELVYLVTCGPHDRPAALLRWSVAQRG
jgi:hypothetical protein